MSANVRRERLDRGIKVRVDDIFAISSYREIMYLTMPRVIMIATLLIFPLLKDITGVYWQTIIMITCAIALLALSWDLLHSVGLVSLGQSIFFGVGAYLTGFLAQRFGLSPLLTIPIATVLGAVICTLLIYPVLRLRGIYFGLITFALPMLFMRVIEATKILGGTEGLNGLPVLPNITVNLYVIIIVTLICLFGFQRLLETDYGLVLKAINDNDRSVIAAGFNISWYKAQAVFIAALPGTFAGAFLTHHYQVVGIPAFATDYSILPLAGVIVGGPGSFFGAMLGAFILVPFSELLRDLGTLRIVIYSLMLLIFVVGLPEGLFPYFRRKYSQFERTVSMEMEDEKK